MKRKRISKNHENEILISSEELTELLIDPSAPKNFSNENQTEEKKSNDLPKPSPYSIK